MLDGRHWTFADPEPDKALPEIARISTRAMSLFVRGRGLERVEQNILQIIGGIEMLEGMDYHHDAFVRLQEPSPAGDHVGLDDHQIHEVVAYLNRMGQFQTFTRSELVRSFRGELPTLSKLMVFRDKNAAHRSIDAPWRADTPSLQMSHALSLSMRFGRYFEPREIEAGDEYSRRMIEHPHETHFRAFQIAVDEEGAWVGFALEREHSQLMGELYGVMERLIGAD